MRDPREGVREHRAGDHQPLEVLGLLARTAAWSAGEPWLDALLAGLAGNRALLARLLAEHLPDVAWTPSGGT